MKTSMAYRLYRLFYNSHADNHALFGNRVHNPMNGNTIVNRQLSGAVIRAILLMGGIVSVVVLTRYLG